MADSERVAASVVAAKSLSSSRGKSSAITPPSRTISDRQPLVSKGLAVEQEVRLGHLVEADRRDALALGDGVHVMVPEQMQARLHAREHLVDRGLPGIFHARQRKRTRRFVRQEDVDPCSALHASTSSCTKCRRRSSRGESAPQLAARASRTTSAQTSHPVRRATRPCACTEIPLGM